MQKLSIKKYKSLYYCICALILSYGFGSSLSLSASHLDFTSSRITPSSLEANQLVSQLLKPRSTLSDFTATSSTISSPEIWSRLRNRFKIQGSQSIPILQRHVKKLSNSQELVDEFMMNASPYLYYVMEEVEKRGMPAEIALVPMVESTFDPTVVSHKGASGIWQIMPQLGRLYGLKQNTSYDGRRDVYESTKVALDHLEYLYELFDGNWLHALAAYNAGEVRVKKAIKNNRSAKKGTDFWSLKLPKETQHYVPKILALATVIKAPKQYGVKLPSIPNKPVITRIKADKAIDVARAAKMAQISEKQLRKLNAGYKKSIASTGPFHLVVPIHHAEGFKRKIESSPAFTKPHVEKITSKSTVKVKTKAKLKSKKKRSKTSVHSDVKLHSKHKSKAKKK